MMASAQLDAAPFAAPQIDYLNAYFYRSGTTWNGGNSSFFDANDDIVQTATLTAGHHYRIAIAWLAIANDLNNPVINQSISLKVVRGNQTVTSASSFDNFQVVDIVPVSTGTHTITIHRMTNTGGNVNLALTVGEVDF
jgi:hypothetical protein